MKNIRNSEEHEDIRWDFETGERETERRSGTGRGNAGRHLEVMNITNDRNSGQQRRIPTGNTETRTRTAQRYSETENRGRARSQESRSGSTRTPESQARYVKALENRAGNSERRMEARIADAQKRLELKSRNIEKMTRERERDAAKQREREREGSEKPSETRNRRAEKTSERKNENIVRRAETNKKRKKVRRSSGINWKYAFTGILALGAVVFVAVLLLWKKPFSGLKKIPAIAQNMIQEVTGTTDEGGMVEMVAREEDETDFLADQEPVSFEPHCTEATRPEKLIQTTGIMVDDVTLSSIADYSPASVIEFGLGQDYTALSGITTFRGNNFRNNPTYGFADMEEYSLEGVWSRDTGSLSYGDASWSGSGWTGQPLMMKWPKEMKAHMNMEEWAKEDDELVEVIYACMDGYIYFTDLRTGKPTRESMYVGYTFKGAGALDPRGYPVLYVGAGYDSYEGKARVFIINLLDCSVMLTFGNDDPFTTRGTLSYFDSSPLVDAETDTLIYPGENGILYLIHLNSQYDQEAGTFSINPDHVVKWNYYGVRTSTGSYWTGMETSAAVYKGFLYVADNGGNLMCINLNTLQLVWVQDTLDDSNSTPVLAVEDGKLYLYVSTSFHLGWRSSYTATVPIWKIDAETGEIVWQTDYECFSESGVSGGVQSTIAVGRGDLSDYLYVTVARTGGEYDGVLSCINKHTGEVVWEHEAFYAWSSPVCVYNSDGTGKVLYCSCGGKMYLLDGKTGETHDDFVLCDGAIEASPAVYEDFVVVGTRSCKIWGIQLK